MQQYRYLIPIAGLFTATLLIANTLDTKIFNLLGFDLPAGIIVFPLAYIFGDILTEVYGYAVSRRVIWTGFASLILMIFCYELAKLLPPASFWENQIAFEQTFSHVPRIVAASIAAYFCGEFVNSYIVARLKVKQQGKHIGIRFVLSTFAGQFVDTGIFIIIAFAGLMPVAALLSIFLSGWFVKVGWEIIVLPMTICVVSRIKKAEAIDVYDRNTNFNPFHFG